MGKKLFSLCMALVLCLGLLPATALAAEEIKLFIAGQRITESGCYENQNGTWTKVEGTGPSSGQFYYDVATFTLTLNEAEITHDQTVKVAEGYTYEGRHRTDEPGAQTLGHHSRRAAGKVWQGTD